VTVTDPIRTSRVPPATAARPVRPVVAWAVIGAVFLLLEAYVFAAWFISGDAHTVATGADAVPTGTKVLAWVFQALTVAALIGTIVWLVRKCRREGRLVFDAVWVIGLASMYWQDPLCNYLRPVFYYNSYLINLGSWAPHIPGWVSPNAVHLPEPLIFVGPIYGSVIPIIALGAHWVMRTASERRPDFGVVRVFLVGWVAMAATVIGFEVIWVHSNLYAYPGALHNFAIQGGSRYQFPLQEALLWGAFLTVAGAVRLYRDDLGQSIAERGTDRVSGSLGRSNLLRALALIGFMNLAMLIYNLGMISLTLHVDRTPGGYPSYLTNKLCGPGTPYRCPAPGVPVYLRPASDGP